MSVHNHSEQRGISKHGVRVFHQFRGAKDSRITAFLQPAGNGPGSVTKALCLQPVPHGSASTGVFFRFSTVLIYNPYMYGNLTFLKMALSNRQFCTS